MQKAITEKRHFTFQGTWITLVRPLTLTGTITPVFTGTAFAAQFTQISWQIFAVFLVSSLLIQMTVNILNDYFDFAKGQDANKWTEEGKGPAHHFLPVVACSMLLLAFALGIWLAMSSTMYVFLFGAISVAGGVCYSAGKRSLASMGLGEVTAAAFLGFAVFVLAVAVQNVTPGILTFAAAVPFALLIASMIMVNNMRAIEKDKGFRCTLPMLLGRQKSMLILTLVTTAAYIWVFFLASVQLIPIPTALVAFAIPVAMYLDSKIWAQAPAMMTWAVHHWVFGLLYALGMWFG